MPRKEGIFPLSFEYPKFSGCMWFLSNKKEQGHLDPAPLWGIRLSLMPLYRVIIIRLNADAAPAVICLIRLLQNMVFQSDRRVQTSAYSDCMLRESSRAHTSSSDYHRMVMRGVRSWLWGEEGIGMAIIRSLLVV